jgi:cytochrome c oxidase subunit 2
MLNSIYQLFSNTIVYNDVPEPLQIAFQDGASPGYTGIVALHDSIFFYLVLVFVGVS